MKKGWSLGGVVVGLHVVVISSLVLMQGCGTTRRASEPSVPAVMPPQSTDIPAPVAAVETPMAPVAAPVEESPVKMEPKTYVVKSGDTISYIAKRFNVSTRDIVSINKLKSPNALRVGQSLQLPAYVDLNAPEIAHPVAKPKAAKPKAAKVSKPVAIPAGANVYTVKSGDSLSVIAKSQGTTVRALRQANNLPGDAIRVGQKLVIPGAAAAAAAPAAEAAPAVAAPAGAEAAAPAPAAEAAPAAATPEAPVVSAPAPAGASAIVHVVEQNQDLNSIAMMYGVRAEEIMKLNSLSAPEVRVGQTLKIPPAQ